MNRRLFVVAAIAALAAMLLVGGCSSAKTAGTTAAPIVRTGTVTALGADTDKDGLPDSAEALLGTDPSVADTDGDGMNDKVDPKPLQADNPIKETSATQGFTIDSVLAENNVDAGGAAVNDHLEITVTNTSGTDITSGWDLFYSLTDVKTGEMQGFYLPLTGFSLKAGQSSKIHVDTLGAAGHFRADPNSSFYRGQNQLSIDVTLHAAGYAPQTASVKKDAAGAEAGGD